MSRIVTQVTDFALHHEHSISQPLHKNPHSLLERDRSICSRTVSLNNRSFFFTVSSVTQTHDLAEIKLSRFSFIRTSHRTKTVKRNPIRIEDAWRNVSRRLHHHRAKRGFISHYERITKTVRRNRKNFLGDQMYLILLEGGRKLPI